MRIYLPEKMIFTKATRPRFISLLKVDKSSCLPKLKSITVLLYDLFYYERKFPTFNFVVEVMFNLRTSSHVLASVIKGLVNLQKKI